MKKKLLLFALLLIMPLNVFAKENEVTIDCDKYILKNKEEVTCKILAKNFNFTATSISGQVKLGNNLELLESNYDSENWKMLDDKFNVHDINLISENKDKKTNFTIATFKIRAKNEKELKEKIQLVNLSIGDENYESHDISVPEEEMDLRYDKQNEPIKENPKTGNTSIIAVMICLVLSLGYSMYIVRKQKEI